MPIRSCRFTSTDKTHYTFRCNIQEVNTAAFQRNHQIFRSVAAQGRYVHGQAGRRCKKSMILFSPTHGLGLQPKSLAAGLNHQP